MRRERVGAGCVWTGGWTDKQISSLAVLGTLAKIERVFFCLFQAPVEQWKSRNSPFCE